LDQAKYELATIVHHEKVVQVEQVESRETEERCDCSLHVSVLGDQFVRRIHDADAQIDRTDDRAVDQSSLGENQQDRSPVEP